MEIINAINIFAIPTICVFVMAALASRKKLPHILYFSFFIYSLIFLTIVCMSSSFLRIKGLHVNWEGQTVLSLVSFVCLYIFAKKFNSMSIFETSKIKKFFILSLVAGVSITTLGYIFSSPDNNDHFFERLVYQMILPGLGEEFIFRGLLLTSINLFFQNKKIGIGNFNLTYGVILSSLPFALGHAFGEDNTGASTLEILGVGTYTFLASVILGLVFEKTKSIWCCTLAHNTANTVGLITSKLFF